MMRASQATVNEVIMLAAKLRTGVRNEKWIVILAALFLCDGDTAKATCGPSDASQDLDRGLVGHWTFDDGNGGVARDVSGRGNHGAVMGGAKWADGRIGGALEFDGADDFVSIPNESNFDLTGSVTVSAWIRVRSFTKAWQAIVTKGDRAWRLHRASRRKSVGFACTDLSRGQVGDLLGKKTVADGQWHHVAGVLDGSRTSIFVDGVLDASAESSPRISVNDYAVLIGANAQARGRLFDGLIDDVRIYDRALSLAELRTLASGDGKSMTVAGRTIPAAQDRASDMAERGTKLKPGVFHQIFDGSTLDGWNALNMSYWSVTDGAITGRSTEANPCALNQFMVWQGGDVADFELKLRFRVSGNGCNSGVQFRSRMREDGLAIGYQADIYKSGGYLGGVCDELHSRNGPELLTANGSKTVIDVSGRRSVTSLEGKAELLAGEWNDYHILAKGQHIILSINGVKCSELIDREEGHFDLRGILGLQLRAGDPMTVQFKDIHLKPLK